MLPSVSLNAPHLFPARPFSLVCDAGLELRACSNLEHTPRDRVRKQIKIRPGYTPQEDVRRFRGTRQVQAEANTLPKGHIIGWAPPSQAAPAPASKAGLSKAQKKNEKRKEKRKEKRDEDEEVKDNWDDEEEGEGAAKEASTAKPEGVRTQEQPNWAAAPDTKEAEAVDGLVKKLDKLEVR